MLQSRRIFLKALGAGVAFVSLPEVSSIFNLFPSAPVDEDDIEAVLRQLFSSDDALGGPFVAHAETVLTETEPQQLLSAPPALMSMLETLGVAQTFSGRVGYGEAAQCRPHFVSQEASWRKRFGADAAFTDVRRAPAASDVAVLVGGNIDPSRNLLYHAEGAIQYRNKPAREVSGAVPGVLRAGAEVNRRHVPLSDEEMAEMFAILGAEQVKTDSGQLAYSYETPLSQIVHVDRPRRNNRVGSRATGVIAVRNKKERHKPNHIYFADLYA